MNIKLLSVIVPIYKQEKYIKNDLLQIYNTLKETPYKFEIIGVVDGTSLDDSYKIAKQLRKPEIKIYGYKQNRGKGLAIRYGMQKTKGDVVTFIDAGGDIKPQGIVMLLEHMKWYNAEIIVASKLHSASKVENYPLLKTNIYYYITKILFRLKIRDTQTGLKAYKRAVLESVLDKLVIKTFAFDIEILAVAKRSGYTRIYDAPVEIQYAVEDSTYSAMNNPGFYRLAVQMLLDTLGIWYRMYIVKYYDDGRKRTKVYDKELEMYINTGAMTDDRQIVISTLNKIYGYIMFLPNKFKNGNKKAIK